MLCLELLKEAHNRSYSWTSLIAVDKKNRIKTQVLLSARLFELTTNYHPRGGSYVKSGNVVPTSCFWWSTADREGKQFQCLEHTIHFKFREWSGRGAVRKTDVQVLVSNIDLWDSKWRLHCLLIVSGVIHYHCNMSYNIWDVDKSIIWAVSIYCRKSRLMAQSTGRFVITGSRVIKLIMSVEWTRYLVVMFIRVGFLF
jgi:hypothetical protein